MKKIVAGTDGSPGSANALRWAGRLASMHDAELVVLTAFAPSESELQSDGYETLLAEQHRELDEWSQAAGVGDDSIRTVVEVGDPRPAIIDLAQREEADLIVIGREGSSAGPGLLNVGSMAEWLAHHAERPVAIVGGAVSTTTRSAIVGVDNSAGSQAALGWLADLTSHAEIRIVAAAVEEPYAEWTPSSSPADWRREAEDQARARWAAVAPGRDTDIEVLTLYGSNVSDALLEAARNERVDIIVVGARGVGGFSGLRIGGVALKVLHRADRPVVIVPPAREWA